MPELLSNIPRNLAWELQTVASQTLVCDQVKSVEDVAVNPEVTVGRVPPSGDAAMPWQSRQREGRPHAKIRDSAISSGQLEVDFACDQVGDRDEIAQ